MKSMKELQKVLNHETLTREEAKGVLSGITRDDYPQEQVTALLTAMQMRGVTVDELLGLRDGVLETGVPAKLDCGRYIDVVGTGGDRKTRSTYPPAHVSSLPGQATRWPSTATTPPRRQAVRRI